MKLNVKFHLIVALAIIQIAFLSFVEVYSSNKLQNIEQFRFVQTKVEKDLCEMSSFLNRLENQGMNLQSAYKKFYDLNKDFNLQYQYIQTRKIKKSLEEAVIKIQKNIENYLLFTQQTDKILQELAFYSYQESSINSFNSIGITSAYMNESENPDYVYAYEKLLGIRELKNEYAGETEAIISVLDKNNETITAYIESFKNRFIIQTIILSVISSIIIAVLISLVTGKIARRIISIRDMTTILAQKDFTTSLDPNGSKEMVELMQNINQMVNLINGFFVVVKTTASKAISSGYSINDSANSTAAASAQIDSNVELINQQFESIAQSVSTAVSAISQMDFHVETLVENNQKQTSFISDSKNSVEQVVDTLSSISSMAVNRTSSVVEMKNLVEAGDEKISMTVNILKNIIQQLDRIKEVVTIIDNVAEQTNLLSMNAAIESAHAGEAGKGFAVVAEEIRNLAEETSENASQIGKVISDIIDYVHNADVSSTAAAMSFKEISSHAGSVIDSFKEITEGIQKIDNQMQQIKDKSDDSYKMAEEISCYCGELSEKQKLVSSEVDSVNLLFNHAADSLKQIKAGTGDIVNRMKEVSLASRESFKNMTDLENILEDFKTRDEVEQAVAKVDEEVVITNIVSKELQENPDNSKDLGEEISLDEFFN